MQNIYLHSYLDSNVDQDISSQNFKFKILNTSLCEQEAYLPTKMKGNGPVLEFEQVLAFVKVQTNQPMFVYSVNHLSIWLDQPLEDLTKSQLRELLSAKLTINHAEFQTELHPLFDNIQTGLGSAMIGLLVFVSIVLMSSLICLIYRCSKKESDEEMERIMQDLNASTNASQREQEQKKYWAENLSPDQIEAIERQKADDIEDELNSRLMNQSLNTIDDFENGAVC